MKDKISVLMTVYNGENYVYESMKSILNQTYNNFEFIIVDDFSDDKSANIVLGVNDKRIKFYKLKKKLGRTKALNFGLRNCESEIIFIQDADDISNNKRLIKSLELFNKNINIGMVCSDYEKIDSNNFIIDKKEIIFKEKKFFSKVKYINLIPHSSIAFKKKALENKIFFYDESFLYAQDYDLILKYIKNSKIGFIEEKLVKIRSHEKNMSNLKEYKEVRIRENLRLLKYSEKYLVKNFEEKINIKFYKLKNYLKLLLTYLGV